MNDIEEERWNSFCGKHNNCKPLFRVKEALYYCCHPTGIGTGITAVCPNCGTKIDITDYNCW